MEVSGFQGSIRFGGVEAAQFTEWRVVGDANYTVNGKVRVLEPILFEFGGKPEVRLQLGPIIWRWKNGTVQLSEGGTKVVARVVGHPDTLR